MNPPTQAGIIAAGWGERLGQKIPKALTPVGGRLLIDYVLDGLQAAGITQVTCIVNEAARAVPEYVAQSKRPLEMDWIIQTTPSSMHSFLIVLERLARSGPGPFLLTTVDGVAAPETYRQFARSFALFPNADVLLGLTNVIEDEKPFRVAMKGAAGTGLMPATPSENPDAFEIVALTTAGFDSDYVTSGFYGATAGLLASKEKILSQNFTALRQLLGHFLKYGSRFYGVPLPPVIDVDRPEDIKSAEEMLKRL
jgi:NDP-sugar pyrophosphorylase family protein